MISISTPSRSSSRCSSRSASASAASSAASGLGCLAAAAAPLHVRGLAVGIRRRLAAEHAARGLLLADEPQAPAPPGNTSPTSSSKLRAAACEGLLEGLLDLAVGVADHRAQLAQRGLEVGARPSSSSTCATRLRVLLLRQRVDRAELLAPAAPAARHARAGRRSPLDPDAPAARLEASPASGSASSRRSATVVSSSSTSCAWSRKPLRGDLGRGHGLAGRAQRRLDLGLLGAHARSSPAISSPASRSAASSRSSAATRSCTASTPPCAAPPRGARRAAPASRSAASWARSAREPSRARSARSRAARSACRALGCELALELGRRTASGPSAGRARRCSISHCERRSASAASVVRALGTAQRRLGRVARAARSARSSPSAASQAAPRAPARPAPRARSRDQAVAAVAPASTRSVPPSASWRSSPHAANQTRPPRVTAMPVKSLGSVLEALDHPRVGQAVARRARAPGPGREQLEQSQRARRRRRPRRACRPQRRERLPSQPAAPCRRRGRRGRAALSAGDVLDDAAPRRPPSAAASASS